MRGAPRQLNADAAVGQQIEKLLPAGFRPVLIVAGGGVQKHQIGRGSASLVLQEMARNGVIPLGLGFRVAKAFGEQLAGTLHRVLLFRDMVAAVVKQARQRLAGRLPVHTVLDAVRQASNQRGAFHQPLGVDDGVILYRLNGLAKGLTLGFDRRGKPGFAPAADRHRDHPLDAFMPGGDLRETLFNHPVEANAGDGLRSVG